MPSRPARPSPDQQAPALVPRPRWARGDDDTTASKTDSNDERAARRLRGI
jgi:hypothetical protein